MLTHTNLHSHTHTPREAVFISLDNNHSTDQSEWWTQKSEKRQFLNSPSCFIKTDTHIFILIKKIAKTEETAAIIRRIFHFMYLVSINMLLRCLRIHLSTLPLFTELHQSVCIIHIDGAYTKYITDIFHKNLKSQLEEANILNISSPTQVGNCFIYISSQMSWRQEIYSSRFAHIQDLKSHFKQCYDSN